MKANTTYHMRAVMKFSDGTQSADDDHTFTMGKVDPAQAPAITVTTSPGAKPQSGVELLQLVSGNSRPTVSDLSGNVLWTYDAVPNGSIPNPVALLPNGHFLINFSEGLVDGLSSEIHEVDLTGALLWKMTAADLNAALAVATCAGCNITVVGTHHDFVPMPQRPPDPACRHSERHFRNYGDWRCNYRSGHENHNPVWLWNEFDHLDVNRRPMGFPDWTHTNAIIYCPDDGSLIISVRHQNWLIKVDYADGVGSGDILWKLGYQGDFTMIGGTDPTDWSMLSMAPRLPAQVRGKFCTRAFRQRE